MQFTRIASKILKHFFPGEYVQQRRNALKGHFIAVWLFIALYTIFAG